MTLTSEGRNPRSMDIDQRETLDILHIINSEDATVPGVIAGVLPQVAAAVDAIVACIRTGGRLIYAGAGSSGRLAVLDAVECVPTFGVPPSLVVPLLAGGERAMMTSVEGAEDDFNAGYNDLAALNVSSRDAVCGIAASGRTPYVLGAMNAAAARGAVTLGISCNDPAPLLDAAQYPIPLVVGPEVLTGSTRLKAGTAQKIVVNMISTTAMIRLGKAYQNLMVDVRPTNAKLVDRASRIIAEVAGVTVLEAVELLMRCNGEAKTAIVVGLLKVTPDEARALLANNDGFLRRVIER
jgi:N-acetylmuramic acid 6-phosphate etherase